MSPRSPRTPPDASALREQILAGERSRLREIRAQARQGKRLEHPDHLQAALHFGRLYREATERRSGSREDFEDRLRTELREAEGLDREHVQIQKWKLPADIHVIDASVRLKYLRRSEPQRSLRHYLAGVRVAADLLRRDREAAQIAFLKELPIWTDGLRLDVLEEVREAADRLCYLLDTLGRHVAREENLMTAFRRVDPESMCWSPFEECLEADSSMTQFFSPVHPTCDFGTHISELRPYPSVPLVRIPMGWVEGELLVEEGPGAAAERFGGPREAGTFVPRPGRLIQYREVRLALAPLNEREAGAVLQSQDALAWRAAGAHVNDPPTWIIGEGNWTDLRDAAAGAWYLGTWRHQVPFQDGWRYVGLRSADVLDHASPAYFEQFDWEWDPIERPGEVLHLGRGYVSTTRLTPDHVHLWLFEPHVVEGEGVNCPWADQAIWQSDGRRPALRSPTATPARSIEMCLRNGSIEAELRRQARHISEQVVTLAEQTRRAAHAAEQELLARWSRSASPETDLGAASSQP